MATEGKAQNPLRRAIARAKFAAIWVLVFSGAINLLVLVSPLYMLQVYDRVLTSGEVATLLFLSLMAAVTLGALAIVDGMRALILGRVSQWLHAALAGSLISAGLEATRRGTEVGAQPLRDLGSLQSFLTGPGAIALIDLPWTFLFLLALYALHPVLAAIALVCGVVIFAVAFANETLTRNALKESSKTQLTAQLHLEASIANAEVAAAMAMQDDIVHRWHRLNEPGLAQQARAMEVNALFTALSRTIRIGAQLVILGVGALLVLSSQLTAGAMVVGSILLGRALAPVEQSLAMWRNLSAAREAWRRLELLLNAASAVESEGEKTLLPEAKGALACEGVVFAPTPKAPPILRGVSFQIAPGETVGIIGPSGSGKSTLCRLITGAHRPSAGAVRLDGAAIQDWPSVQRGRFIGYLPQDVELFPGTIRENIARLREEDPQLAVDAALLAGAHEEILRLPEAYETDIRGHGETLSGGMRQRIGLARALYGSPRLVVLDEPGAHLDKEGDAALQAAIAQLRQRAVTVIMVAHRPSALAHVDKLALLQEGQLKRFGPRDQVLGALAPRGPISLVTAGVPTTQIRVPE